MLKRELTFQGIKNSPYSRLLPPEYGEFYFPHGVTEYSIESGYKSDLPSPRLISDQLFAQGLENETESLKNTHMLMQWGQFISHDISEISKNDFDCCEPTIRCQE